MVSAKILFTDYMAELFLSICIARIKLTIFYVLNRHKYKPLARAIEVKNSLKLY